jgi:xanthine dehydrogenase accessory factor
MISDQLSARRHELAERGEPFVTATVVRVQHPTSVEPGSTALIRGDGTIEGFVGGVCAEQSVRLYSLKAIDSGEPVLLRILPGQEGAQEEDGAVTVSNPCLSGGAIEIFLEPALPPPRIAVAGESLIAASLRSIAPELGLEVVDAAPSAGHLALVVAAHGRDELVALRQGLEAGVAYVGLVASRKRGAAVLDELRGHGVTEELVQRIETPAGLDIGARTPAEIALSILARVVEVRRSTELRPHPVAATAPATAVDPICGMEVVIGGDTPSSERDGEMYYFCCEGCRAKFDEQRAHASRP